MRTLARLTLMTSTVALLIGCGGSQSSVGLPAATQQPDTGGSGSGSLILASHDRVDASAGYKVTPPLLYVADVTNNVVTVYHARSKDPAPAATISAGLRAPTGDCLDGHGTLYVTNDPPSGAGWITEYPLGRTKPSETITDGINTPAFCAVDGSGNLWVTNIGGPNATEYLSGSKKPHLVITKGLVYPIGIAIDHSGNLYIANRPVSGSPNIEVYAQGAKAPARTITDGVTWPVGIGVDSQGTLYVTNATGNNVEEYRPGQEHPYRAISKTLDDPVALVLNTKGWLYVANFGNSNDVVEFPPGSSNPAHRHISKGVYAPIGVAYFPPLLP